MRYARFLRADGKTVCGIVKDNSTVEICSGEMLTGLTPTGEIGQIADVVEWLPPVDPPNVIAIGANYVDHCKESNKEPPKLPLVFMKATNTVAAHKQQIVLPRDHPGEVDYEAELAVVIGKTAKHVEQADALDYVFGYTCANDVSARDVQIKIDTQWVRGKSFDTFCPLGPWVETELEAANLPIRLRLNGEEMQNQPSSDMIFSVERIIEFLSAGMTLFPGTVILTGTPSGVGFARDPAVFLKPGDKVEVDIGGIGVLENEVVSA